MPRFVGFYSTFVWSICNFVALRRSNMWAQQFGMFGASLRLQGRSPDASTRFHDAADGIKYEELSWTNGDLYTGWCTQTVNPIYPKRQS